MKNLAPASKGQKVRLTFQLADRTDAEIPVERDHRAHIGMLGKENGVILFSFRPLL